MDVGGACAESVAWFVFGGDGMDEVYAALPAAVVPC